MTDGWRRILLTVEYDGTRYAGWQRQLNANSVQAEIEKVLRIAEKQPITVSGASRTDAGVHARGQRVHFDTQSRIPVDKYPFVFNSLLPEDISVAAAREVPPSLHARFSAQGKLYTYRIHNRRQPCAMKRRFAAHVPLPLDTLAMQEAASLLVGTHDFAAFAASDCTAKTTVRTLHSIEVVREGDDIQLLVQGNAFLYNMVRIIAGTLIYVGQHRIEKDVVADALAPGNRLLLGPTAPPCGLELTRVYYEGGL